MPTSPVRPLPALTHRRRRLTPLVTTLSLVTIALLAIPTFAQTGDATTTAATTQSLAETIAAATPAAPSVEDRLKAIEESAKVAKMNADTMWTLIAAFLVFFMNLGFAMVESGLARSKNCVNILAKNFVVFAFAAIGFYLIGWGMMFGGATGADGVASTGKFIGSGSGLFALSGTDADYPGIAWANVPLSVKFFFQLVFAATAATIVSGAVAERIKFGAFVFFSIVLCAVIYPIVGHMIWGGGYLATLFKGPDGKDIPMLDFAGSTVVHSVGGWAALAGVLVLGPRLGKYTKDGRVNPIPGHNMTSVTLGGLVLWFGWFGFNPGSTMAADGPAIGHIALTTGMAAVAATLTATFTAWILLGKPDLSMIVNGTLAGLVAITAPCAFVSLPSALIIGSIAGIIVVFAVLMFDKLKLDDPVGALSVHLVNGIFGTLCVGLFSQSAETFKHMPGCAIAKDGLFFGGGMTQLTPQLVGIAVAGAITFTLSFLVWTGLKLTMGIRVSEQEELEGLDIGEHSQEAYPDFAPSLARGTAYSAPAPVHA